VGLVLVAVGFLVGARALSDNSFLTHLATGRLILASGTVPDADPYSWTAPGQPWVVQSWLASVLYASLERLTGLEAVRALNGALTAGVVAALWVLTAPVRALPERVLLVAAPVAIGTGLWTPRPLLFGLAGVAVVLVVVQGRLPARWLLPVFVAWGATHGSFPAGLAVIAAFAAGAYLDERRLPRRELGALAWAGVGSLAVLVGPLGPSGLWFPVALLARHEVLGDVGEWRPPSFDSPQELVWLALVLGFVVVAARRGAPWRAIVPAALAIVLGLLAVRNLAVSSLVLVAVVAPLIRGGVRPGGVHPDERGVVAAGVGLVGVIMMGVALTLVATTPPTELSRFPVAEVDHLAERGVLGDPGIRVITTDRTGNYLHYRFGPSAPVFIDDRVDMYPPDLVADYVVLLRGGDQQAVLDRWQPHVVLWPADGPLRHWLDGRAEWDLVLTGEDHVVYCLAGHPVRARCD
jgi:hypothetical protein